jgi:hypothetical protein
MTTIVLYFFGVLGFLGAAYLGFQIGPLLQGRFLTLDETFQLYVYAGGAAGLVLQSVLLVAAGRAMEHLKTIAENSEYLVHLERLDPAIAAELDSERQEEEAQRAVRAERGFLGLRRRRE